jgi:hypothetical protein
MLGIVSTILVGYFYIFNYTIFVDKNEGLIVLTSWLNEITIHDKKSIHFTTLGPFSVGYGIIIALVNGKKYPLVYRKKRGLKYLLNPKRIIVDGIDVDLNKALGEPAPADSTLVPPR